MAPYSIFTVGPNGLFVSVKEIMASSGRSARTCTSATRSVGPGGVERGAKDRGAIGPSANAFAPNVVARLGGGMRRFPALAMLVVRN